MDCPPQTWPTGIDSVEAVRKHGHEAEEPSSRGKFRTAPFAGDTSMANFASTQVVNVQANGLDGPTRERIVNVIACNVSRPVRGSG